MVGPPPGLNFRFSPSYKVQRLLDKPVPLLTLPIFVLANTAIVFSPRWYENILDSNTPGVLAGLVLGKPLGIVLSSLIAVGAGMRKVPDGHDWRYMTGMGMLGGTKCLIAIGGGSRLPVIELFLLEEVECADPDGVVGAVLLSGRDTYEPGSRGAGERIACIAGVEHCALKTEPDGCIYVI